MRILVTGATGYIGSRLVGRLLELGHQVGAIVLEGTTVEPLKPFGEGLDTFLYDGSIKSLQAAVAGCRPELVFHVASLVLVSHGIDAVDRLIASNVQFPAQLFEVMEQFGVRRIVNVGTSWQHFGNADYSPVNLYAATKQACEDILAYYTDVHGFEATTLRLFDTYGPGDTRPKLFSHLRQAAKTGEAMKMTPGEQSIEIVFIDDILDAFVLAANQLKPGRRVFGVGTGQPIALRQLVGLYEEVVGRRLVISWGGISYREREIMVPWNRYDAIPGWVPKTSLRDGIRKMEQDASIGGLLAVD